MWKKLLPPLLTALGFASLPSLALDLVVDTRPPEARVETMPAPREGYVWAPGYYTWRDNRYEWVDGHWERARKGFRYQAPRWVEDNGRWRFTDEQWIVDEDSTYGRNANESSRTR